MSKCVCGSHTRHGEERAERYGLKVGGAGRRENVGSCERGTPRGSSSYGCQVLKKFPEVLLTGDVILRRPVTGGICGAVESMTWAVRDAAGLSPRAASMRKHVSLATAPSAAVVKTQALQARGCEWQLAQQLAPVAF